MKVATWNVNSIRTRLGQVVDWLQTNPVDVLCLQETKVVDADFPRSQFENIGYHLYVSGQKSYNGVVGDVRIVNLYVPNGAAVGSDKYQYKLQWLQVLREYLKALLEKQPNELCVCGDFNIAPDDRDIHNPKGKDNSIMASPAERQALGEVLEVGLADAFRKFTSEGGYYTWWDYRQNGFVRDRGWRIDHHYLTANLYDRAISCTIDKAPRKLEQPSDHTPVIVEF